MPTVRLERDGLFGRVGVVDTADARRFTIGGVLQGASLLRPPAASVHPSLPAGPGPVIETRCQLAWLLAGQRHPAGRGLMLGFGGGCGTVGLLHQFPGLEMDAIDADPAMVAMAREFHPLAGHYEKAGRLRLHVADAHDFVEQSGGGYDFVIADLCVNADWLGRVDAEPLIRSLAGVCSEAWFRVFGSLRDGEIHPVLEKFGAAGLPVRWLYSPVSAAVPIPRARDWILAAGAAGPPDSQGFVPFAGIRDAAVSAAQRAYRKMAAEPLPAPQVGL